MSAPGKQSHAHVTTFTHTQGFHQSRQLIRALAALALLSLFNKEDSHAASALAKQWRKESFHRWATIPTNLLTRAETFNRLLCAKVGLSSIWWLTLPLINSQGTLRWCASKPLYLLNRLFLDTMRRKPVGSVTELSLLLSSSNCWSNKSPASLSVSLLEHPLKERKRWSERHPRPQKCCQEKKKHVSTADNTLLYCFAADKSSTHRNTHTHRHFWPAKKHTPFNPHTLGLFFSAWIQQPDCNPFNIMPVMLIQSRGCHPPPITSSQPLSHLALHAWTSPLISCNS